MTLPSSTVAKLNNKERNQGFKLKFDKHWFWYFISYINRKLTREATYVK